MYWGTHPPPPHIASGAVASNSLLCQMAAPYIRVGYSLWLCELAVFDCWCCCHSDNAWITDTTVLSNVTLGTEAVLGIFIWLGQSKAKQILGRPTEVVYVGIMGMTRAVWVGQARVWVGHGLPGLIARTASDRGPSWLTSGWFIRNADSPEFPGTGWYTGARLEDGWRSCMITEVDVWQTSNNMLLMVVIGSKGPRTVGEPK